MDTKDDPHAGTTRRLTVDFLVGTEEVAAHFGVTPHTIYRWCKEGRLPCMKVGKHWRMRRSKLLEFPQGDRGPRRGSTAR